MTQPHLSPQERSRAYNLLETHDPDLADKLAAVLLDNDDPVLGLLKSLIEQQTAAIRDSARGTNEELRALRRTMYALCALAMILMGGLVGLQVSISGGGYALSTGDPPSPILLQEALETPLPGPWVDTGLAGEAVAGGATGLSDG